MEMDRPQRLLWHRWAAGLLGALLLVAAAAPEQPLLILDSAIFAEDRCLAPALDECFASDAANGAKSDVPSASAALILPGETRQLFLSADPLQVIDFGPELALPKARQRLSRSAARTDGCIPAARHRPDRTVCSTAAARKRR